MSDAGQETDPHMTRPDESGVESDNGSRGRIQSAAVRTRIASQRHVSLAVPFRAAERNRRVASSVLAGGVAYRLFLWLLPFSFLVGGVLGLGDERTSRRRSPAAALPEAVVAASGTSPRRGDELVVAPLARRVAPPVGGIYGSSAALIHALVWGEAPPKVKPLKSSLVFSAACPRVHSGRLVHVVDPRRDGARTASHRSRDGLPACGAVALGLLLLPHGQASWKALVPGALFTAIGFQVLHWAIVHFGNKLEKSTSLY